MKEKQVAFTIDEKEYKAVFNLNVMQAIQIEYGTFDKWGELTDGFVYDENGERIAKLDENGDFITREITIDGKKTKEIVYETREVNIKALIFGIKEMMNEAIDIDNELKAENEKQAFLNTKQVGRLITKMGIQNATQKLNKTIVDSTQEDNPKNE